MVLDHESEGKRQLGKKQTLMEGQHKKELKNSLTKDKMLFFLKT
jgi:hypothetical protein